MSPGPRSWRLARSAHFCSGSHLAFVQRSARLPRSSVRSRLSGRQSSQSAFSGICTCRSKSVCGGPKLPSWRSHWAPWFLRPCLASGGCTKAPFWRGRPGCRRRCGPAALWPSIGTCVWTKYGSAGKPTRINGLTTDVTERKRFEDELSLAWKTAELADRAKSSFLAAASHDLRQPLQTLKLLQAALEPHHPSGEARKLVAGIGQSLDTMTSILSSLLDVNRLESGNLRPSVSEFSLNEIFEPLAVDFVAPVQERGLRLCIVRSGLIVRSDRRMLAEMIRNLLSNAVRYTDRGRILLGCRRAGDNVRIEVWDSGVGITEDQLPHIFHEYYQGTGGAERGGFGLGLAIVKRLGEILDHRVEVRSIPGKGTRFFIEVPRGRSSVKVPEAAPLVHPHNDAFLGSVLAIEDEDRLSPREAARRMIGS